MQKARRVGGHSHDQTLEAIVGDLRRATGASRTTLRLEDAAGDFPIVAEDRGDGIPSLRGRSVGDLRAAATFRHLERERVPLIQDDLLDADPAPPAALIEQYGARAQMLAPLLRDGRLVGIVSVHESAGPRAWTSADVAALETATARIAAHITERGADE